MKLFAVKNQFIWLFLDISFPSRTQQIGWKLINKMLTWASMKTYSVPNQYLEQNSLIVNAHTVPIYLNMVYGQEEDVCDGFWQTRTPVRFSSGRVWPPSGSFKPKS